MQACRLAANDLACRRGDRVLFSGVGFALEAGGALHVIGPNGVGKSSLIRIVAGLMRPFAGSVDISGTVGLLDERHALDPARPLDKALAFWNRLDGNKQSADTIDRLGLAPLMDVPVRYLSTGQRKRAALARLAAQGAGVWLLDEPFNGLDSEAAAVVEHLVAEHCGSGGVALIASHQPFALAGMTSLPLAEHVR